MRKVEKEEVRKAEKMERELQIMRSFSLYTDICILLLR